MPAKKIVHSRDDLLREILENSFFQREGFEMVSVDHCAAALASVEEGAPILAILDLEQFGEQALACCRAIKSDSMLSVTPVLLLFPEAAPATLADDCWEAGCDALVHRPLTAERLLDTACGLIGISRRLARRFPVSFHLELLDRRERRHVGSCVNLNMGGMFLATEMLLPVDTVLGVEFVLPGFRSPLNCQVRVAWANHPEWRKKNNLPCGMGVQFVALPPAMRAVLEEFLARIRLEE